MKRKKYSLEECKTIKTNYMSVFKDLPQTPIGFDLLPIIDLMEMAIERGKPLEWNEYEHRFHYKDSDSTY